MIQMDNFIRNNNYNLRDAIIRQSEKINTGNKSTAVNHSKDHQASFKDILNQNINNKNKVSFSKHANLRTQERNIQISQGDMNRLDKACEKIQKKGIKDALVVMNDTAFIMNAATGIVVTVMDKNEMKENVFTNIDGAVFL